MSVSKLKTFFIGAGILVAGFVGLFLMIALRPDPPKEERVQQSPLVTTVNPEIRQGSLMVRGNGTVRPTREINLAAEVAGKIVDVSSALVSGGSFRTGQVLVHIDSTDYLNAVAMAQSEVTQRQYELLLAQEEMNIAREEWERLKARVGTDALPDSSAMGSLVLKEPQYKLAQALLNTAKTRLADAETRLARTHVKAPFNGRVRTKQVDLGQYVGPGQAVAMIYNTDQVEIVVPLPSRDAALIPNLWTRAGSRGRIAATVRAEFGGKTYEWDGYVDRTEGAIAANTRTVNVVVRVSNPYRSDETGRPPLLVDMFTEVEIQGAERDHYVVLPREALREGSTVWVAEAGVLQSRPVEVLQEVGENIILIDGFRAEDQVITSNLTVMTEGMSVRVAE